MSQSPSRRAQSVDPTVTQRTFPEIIPLLLEGIYFARLEWQASEPEAKIYMKAGLLHILRNGAEYTLTVSDGDMTASDWIIV